MVRSAWNSVNLTGGRVTGQARLGLVEDCRCVVEMARAAVAECVMSSGPLSVVAATLVNTSIKLSGLDKLVPTFERGNVVNGCLHRRPASEELFARLTTGRTQVGFFPTILPRAQLTALPQS
ncbi:hypothetical protein L914_17986 [Phytophthora nicotianae]|uniref:Uncharacterized protein n=1 Tax=Phytophthora nicotianae TaxID=4792 RepID=W2MHT9_PHYNI|nr:hypothetical protein L914_17986 [Phytophthora nicotianae]